MTREEFISMMGYSDNSPLRNEKSLDIRTGDNGIIDMSNTGMPLMANGRYLPPYSGHHQFEPNSVVTEHPLLTVKKREGKAGSIGLPNSTHLMQHEQLQDGTWIAFPKIFQDENGKWKNFEEINERDGWWENYQYALKRNEVYGPFESEEHAASFAVDGTWKNPTMTPQGEYNQEGFIPFPRGNDNQIQQPGEVKFGGQLPKAQINNSEIGTNYDDQIISNYEHVVDYWNQEDENSLLNRRLRGDFLETEKYFIPSINAPFGSWDDFSNRSYSTLPEGYSGNIYNKEGYNIPNIQSRVRSNLFNMNPSDSFYINPKTEQQWDYISNLDPDNLGYRDIITIGNLMKNPPKGSHMVHNKGVVGPNMKVQLSPNQLKFMGDEPEDIVDVADHEVAGHGTLGNEYNLSERDAAILNKFNISYQNVEDPTDHHKDEGESYSDIQAVRLDMLNRGIYNWKEEQMTPDQWIAYLKLYDDEIESGDRKQYPIALQRTLDRYRISDQDQKYMDEEGIEYNKDQNIQYINNVIAMENQNLDISKYGGQHNWALDLRPTTIASHGREVKNDDLYSNDRYSQNASKYKKMLPKYQSEGAWDKFEDSKVGKFVDAKGLREEKDFWMRTFGYGKGEEKDAAMDAGAIFHPGFDLAHSKTKFDEGKYLDAGLYAGFAALPFTAGPLVRGTKKHIINPIKNLFKAAPTPRGTTYNKYNQIKTSFDDLITDNADFGFGVESGIIREGNLPVRSGNLKIAVHGNAKLDEDWMVHIKKIDGGAMQLVKRPGTKNAYYLDMSMESPIDAGEALKYLEEYIPKGSTLSSNATLSLDSYKLMLNRVKRGKFSVVPGTKMLNRGLVPADNRIDLNMMSKEMSKLDINSAGMITKKEADNIVKKVNKMLSDAGVEGKAKAIDHSDKLFAQGAINETHSKLSPELSKALTWRVDLPNLTLKMEYQKGGENILPKFQDKGAWDDFKESSVGKFVDARGFERMFGMDQGIGRTFGDYFGYDSDEGKDMLLDAGAIFHPGPDFMHSATKYDEGEYTDAALYAGFGILPFTAGPLVRGTKKHIINPIKEFFSSGSSKIAGETATHVYNPASKQWIEKNTIKVNAKLLANDAEYLIKQDYVHSKVIKLKQGKIKITDEIKKFKIDNPGVKVPKDLQKIDNVINGQLDAYTKQLDNIPPQYTPLKKGDGFMGLEFDKAGKKWEGPTMKSTYKDIRKKLIKELDKAEKLDIQRIVGDYKWDNRNIFKKYFNTPTPPK